MRLHIQVIQLSPSLTFAPIPSEHHWIILKHILHIMTFDQQIIPYICKRYTSL